jgi:hypothetical protein
MAAPRGRADKARFGYWRVAHPLLAELLAEPASGAHEVPSHVLILVDLLQVLGIDAALGEGGAEEHQRVPVRRPFLDFLRRTVILRAQTNGVFSKR